MKATAVVTMTRHRVAERCATAKSRVACWTLLSLPVRSILGISLTIGCLVAVVSLAAPHHIAAAISGIGATLTAMKLLRHGIPYSNDMLKKASGFAAMLAKDKAMRACSANCGMCFAPATSFSPIAYKPTG